MAKIVQMVDGTLIDLDVVVGVSPIYCSHHYYSDQVDLGYYSKIVDILFDLLVVSPTCISFYSGKPIQNKITIRLHKGFTYSYNLYREEPVNTEDNTISSFKRIIPSYRMYTDFVELWKTHRESNAARI